MIYLLTAIGFPPGDSSAVHIYTQTIHRTHSVEIPTRCSFVIEFIIPKLIEGSTSLSSGALNCVCNLWFIYPCGDRPLPRLSGKWIRYLDC
jgi:hypothetical protein